MAQVQVDVADRKDSRADSMEEPFLKRNAAPEGIQIYHPYRGKEVVRVDDSSQCLAGVICGGGASESDGNWEVMCTIRSSVWFNAILFLGKLYAYAQSHSLAVLASLVDSTIDLLGQGVLLWTKQLATSRGQHGDYPIGRGRLEPVGVMVCAIVMGMASIEVISTSGMKIWQHWGKEDVLPLHFTDSVIVLLIVIIIVKGVLYWWCRRVLSKQETEDEAVKAIAQDNWNDVMSNFVALLAPWLTQSGGAWWLADPVAGILISIYIIYSWVVTGFEQVEMIVGKSADPETLTKIQEMAMEHHPNMQLDQLCAYHFGPRYLVEVEVVMPETTTLKDSHDEGIKLQHKIELLDDVERCFVHIDYQLRECDDHDPNVPIEAKLYGGPRPGSPRGTMGSLEV